jgi:protein TonB
MKKNASIIAFLVITYALGQTKKIKSNPKKATETIEVKEIPYEKRSNYLKGDRYGDDPITIDSAPTIQQEDENIIYNTAGVEVQPEFPGGKDKLFSYISKNMELSDDMRENEVKGKIVASFIVERDGSISNIKIISDLGFGTGIQAERALKKMPRWNPAVQNGKKVRCSFMIPIMIYATKQ